MFLDNLIHFNYSINNKFLIWLQDPTARYVASYTTFNKMGYKVNKSANDGIKIFIPRFYIVVKITDNDGKVTYCPYFKLTEEEKNIYKDKKDDSIVFHKKKLARFSLGNVFNVNDTDMPIDDIQEESYPTLNDKTAEEIKDCFIKTIYSDGFKVKFEELDGETKGYCNHKQKLIVVSKNLGSLMKMKVLIHEYAHALAHKHLEDNNKEYQEHRRKYEAEAESISYVVSKYLGIPMSDSSLAYLYNYSKEKDFYEIEDSFDTIMKYSKKIIDNYEKFYNREFGLYAEEYKVMGY